jgi:ABC-type transport system involved in multi-copper enzyme maturation permease subunit
MSESSFRSPFAALVWKEWRESWWLLILMVVGPTASYGLCVALYANGRLKGPIMVGLPAFALWMLALCLSAGLFAGDCSRGTSAFHLERPVSRGAIWNAKLLMPILALAASEILFIVAVGKLYVPEPWRARLHIVPFMFLVMGFLCFASGVFCSVMLSRPVSAWAAGGVLWVVSALLLQALFDRLFQSGISREQTGPWLLWLSVLTLEAIGLLWLSRVAYVRWMRD